VTGHVDVGVVVDEGGSFGRRAAAATRRATLVVGAVTAVFAMLPLVRGRFFGGVDVWRVEHAVTCEARALLSRGFDLTFSVGTGQGAPLLTSPNAALHSPLRWLSLLFAPDLASHVHAALHLVVLALGTAWLARTFGARATTAAAAGLMASLSGTALDLVTHSTYLVGAAFVPVAWAAARRMRRRRDRARAFFACAGALGASFVVGEPQAFAIGAALVVVEAARAALALPRSRTPLVLAVIAVAIGAAIGGALFAPTLAELSLSSRSATESLPMATVLARAFTPAEWPALVVPAALTDVGQHMLSLRVALGDDAGRRMWNLTPYVGAFALACTALGALLPRARPLVVVVAVAALLSIGAHGPLPILIEVFPPLGIFRFPAKYLAIAAVAAPVVVALVLERAMVAPLWRRRVARAALLSVGALVAVVVAAVVFADSLDALPPGVAPSGLASDRPPLSVVVFRRALLALALTSLAPLVLAFSTRRPALSRALPFVVVAEYAALFFVHAPLGSPVAEAVSPLAALVDEGALVAPVVCRDPRAGVASMYQGGVIDPVEHARRHALLGQSESQACHGLSSVVEYAPTASSLALTLVDGLGREPSRARALGCDLLLTPHDETPPGARASAWPDVGADRLYGLRLLVVTDPLPHVAAVSGARLVAGDQAVKDALDAGDDPLSIVDDPLFRLSEERRVPALSLARVARAERPSPDRFVIALDGEGPALVFVKTSFRVGWTAMQGERALPVVRVGGLFVGVVVDDARAGEIALTYVPPRASIARGVALAALVLLVLGVLALARTRVKRG